MILVDTSIWIDHLHRADVLLVALLEAGQVGMHPMVLGELSLGGLKDRNRVLSLLRNLPQVAAASHDECMVLVERAHLHGRGLALVDAHLLASALLTPSAKLWTRDRRLATAAEELDVGWRP